MVARPSVHDFHAPVQGVALFVLAGGGRTFLAVADDPDLLGRNTHGDHHLAHGIGPALAQGDVVFAAAALVGMPLQLGDGPPVAGQGAGVGFDDGPAFGTNIGAIVLEVDDPVRRHRVAGRAGPTLPPARPARRRATALPSVS